MTSIEVTVTGAEAVARVEGILTGGMVGVPVTFVLDNDWVWLHKTAVFRAGDVSIAVPLEDETLPVPWEALRKASCTLYIGLYGLAEDGDLTIPTVWAEVGTIQPGADPEGDPAMAPTLPVWKQAMDIALGVQADAYKGLFDGYSPVRGVDYWTEEDKAQVVAEAETAMLGDIEAALDSILQIQNALIGGDGV